MKATQLSFPHALLPDAPGLVLKDARFTDHEMVAVLRSTALAACCPLCGASSSSVHSRYRRAPTDLPWGGHPVKLILCVRKFFCRAPSCAQRIFTERLPEVIAPYSRTTARLTTLLRAIAFALGGEAGARLARCIGLVVSPATLISLIRKTPLPEPSPARVLGVDDWAHRKGTSYGTALVDLEDHRLIELLPDREAQTLAHWLKANPGTEVISRDRSEKYASGGRQGAPEAVQVADRWHLISNWREVVQRVFERYRGPIRQVALPSLDPAGEPTSAVLETTRGAYPRHEHEKERQTRAQARRQARYEVIRERYSKGEHLGAIARDLGLDYRTVRKYALSDECPQRKPYPERGRMIDPYEPYIRARWAEGCKNGLQLHREIVENGYPGSRNQVATLVARLRREENGGNSPQPLAAAGEPLKPRKASMLLLRREDQCSEAESTALAQLAEVHEEIATTVSFTERFVKIVRERRGGELGKWLSDAESSGIREIRQFARRVRQDEDAVRAGCTLTYSNGPTEGKITKLKAIKRSMYGRAKFDLLRRRALYAA
jgi:transposase